MQQTLVGKRKSEKEYSESFVIAQPGRTGTRITRKELIIESSFQEWIIREIRGICGIPVQIDWVEKGTAQLIKSRKD